MRDHYCPSCIGAVHDQEDINQSFDFAVADSQFKADLAQSVIPLLAARWIVWIAREIHMREPCFQYAFLRKK